MSRGPPGTTSMCLFLRKTSDKLQIDPDSRSISTDLGLVQWLQDTGVSGKCARLRINPIHQPNQSSPDQMQSQGPSERALSPRGSTGLGISTILDISLPARVIMQSTQLEIATTQDPTDAQVQAVPFRIVPHVPPFKLITSLGFLLPEYTIDNRRSEYAACYLPSLSSIQALPMDDRFHVEDQLVETGKDCLGHPVLQKRFWAVRSQQCDFCGRYQPWNELYDVAVILSPERCLTEAIDLGDLKALRTISSRWIFNAGKKQKCGVLQLAVRLGRLKLIPELLQHWDPDCPGCDETPLGVAAMEGNVAAMNLLLDSQRVKVDTMDANGWSPLFRATQHCNIPALKHLIDKKSNVNLFVGGASRAQGGFITIQFSSATNACRSISCKLPCVLDPRCYTPLMSIFGCDRRGENRPCSTTNHSTGYYRSPDVVEIVKILQEAGANLTVADACWHCVGGCLFGLFPCSTQHP